MQFLLKTSVLLLSAALAAQQSEPATPTVERPAALETIRSDELLRHASWFAADERQGRLTGSPGQEAAAAYIAAHFEELGLEPLGDALEAEGDADGEPKRGYLQHYGITRTYVDESTQLNLGALEMKQGFAILGGREMEQKIDGELVFCGLGRTRGSSQDIADDVDLEGKVAVVAIKGPRGRLPDKLSVEQKFGMSFRAFSQLSRTSKALARKGASAVLFVQHEDPLGLSDVLNYMALSPGKATVTANFPGADPGMGMLGRMGGGDGVPSLVMSVPASVALLQELGVDMQQYPKYLEGEAELPESKQGTAATLTLLVKHDGDARASNVVAVLRGSDPKLRDEAIVYSAHMDHVGMRMDGDVFNGADDNASGSAGLLAIASAFAKSEQKPRRSIIFLSVSGEELGLWGSQYYSDNPTWQLDEIVADINTDMIGRSGPESGPMQVTVTPSNGHAHYSTIVRQAHAFAETLGMEFTDGDKYYQRSDHYNFARKGIPVVFFCNGEHEDYHQVSDHADKLDGDKMERIARLAFWTGWHVANQDERPKKLGRQRKW